MTFFGKISDWRHRHLKSRVWDVVLNKYFIVTVLFVLFILFLDNNNFFMWLETRKTLDKQKTEIEFYKQEITTLSDRLESLENSRDSIETFAREQFHYLEDGEDIYFIKK